MAQPSDPFPPDAAPFDPSIQTEKIAFDSSELVKCGGCGRANSPERQACIYCGNAIETRRVRKQRRTQPRKLESWERGFNVVLTGDPRTLNDDLKRTLSLDPARIRSILEAGVPLPIARLAARGEADQMAAELLSDGIGSLVVPDTDLHPDTPPVRLSKINFGTGTLEFTDFNRGIAERVALGDLKILVVGRIVVSTVDVMEKKRRRGRTGLLEETTTVSDETVLDIYTNAGPPGYRIYPTGFDYSCLGDEMRMIAVENLRLLIDRLCTAAPQLKYVSDYDRLRESLGAVWDIDECNDPKGLRRTGFGRREFGSVAATSNLGQFTRFSRLQWHLL